MGHTKKKTWSLSCSVHKVCTRMRSDSRICTKHVQDMSGPNRTHMGHRRTHMGHMRTHMGHMRTHMGHIVTEESVQDMYRTC